MSRIPFLLGAAICLLFTSATLSAAAKPLEIHFIDVEGGQATLIVDPRGPALLDSDRDTLPQMSPLQLNERDSPKSPKFLWQCS